MGKCLIVIYVVIVIVIFLTIHLLYSGLQSIKTNYKPDYKNWCAHVSNLQYRMMIKTDKNSTTITGMHMYLIDRIERMNDFLNFWDLLIFLWSQYNIKVIFFVDQINCIFTEIC